MNTSFTHTHNAEVHASLSSALITVEQLVEEGHKSLKLYRSDMLWYVALSNVVIKGEGK